MWTSILAVFCVIFLLVFFEALRKKRPTDALNAKISTNLKAYEIEDQEED